MAKKMFPKMNNDQWTQLIDAIEQCECILMLGPGTSCISIDDQFKPLTKLFSKELTKDLKKNNVLYEEKYSENLSYITQLYLTMKNVIPTTPVRKAKDFYTQNARINTIHEDLASLPFYLIINTNPDDLMIRALEKVSKEFIFDFYNFRKDVEKKIEEPSQEKPVIYNIFGSFKEPSSIIMTEGDCLKFISKIVKSSPRIPTNIRSEFDETKIFLFLGFDYEQWHLRLLLHSLNLQKNVSSFSPNILAYQISKLTEEFYRREFRFRFVNDDIFNFVSELRKRYEKKYGKEKKHPSPPDEPYKVVIMFSREDFNYKQEIRKYLSVLEQKGYISIWDESMISPGLPKEQVIHENISNAKIILPLVSADLLDSDVTCNQLDLALTLSKKRKVKLVPIIIRSCLWEDHALSNMELILPEYRGKKPVKSVFWNSEDDAFKNIAKSLKNLIFNFLRES